MASPEAIDTHLSDLRTKAEWDHLTSEQIEALGDADQPLSTLPLSGLPAKKRTARRTPKT